MVNIKFHKKKNGLAGTRAWQKNNLDRTASSLAN